MKLYRKMFAAADGRPAVGDGRNMLGVRPANPARKGQAADVKAVAGTDPVRPGEGLSAYDDPSEIPPQVAGEVWVIETDDLPAQLCPLQRGKNKRHVHIEPAVEVTLDQLQGLLASTREMWQPLDPGATA